MDDVRGFVTPGIVVDERAAIVQPARRAGHLLQPGKAILRWRGSRSEHGGGEPQYDGGPGRPHANSNPVWRKRLPRARQSVTSLVHTRGGPRKLERHFSV